MNWLLKDCSRSWGWVLLLVLLGISPAALAQPVPETANVVVDGAGVLRWQGSRQEVALFGVNYTTPFAYSYRAHQRLGLSPEQAIDQDVYHLSRLGVDAFRVHVWDVEITDTLGNLLENEHLRLLDYLIQRLKQRRIKIVLTPIAYWGNGYPAPDTLMTGFSAVYPKNVAYRHPRAIRAQENYLGQFLNHRNSYTGLLNRADPDIIAYEVCNEPHYRQPEAEVSQFVARMVAAMRATGYQKPIFYNLAESPAVANAILSSPVQGFTFQWYPSALVGGHALQGNLLPLVNQYPIPYAQDPRFRRQPHLVYEFESADILQPVMYPMMARSFRSAGFQWATQFAYDPMAIAYANTEYQTHYLNLAYTPAKALSLLIAGHVFRHVPRNQPFGTYPQDSVFANVRVSYRAGLSELNTPTTFYYTTSTTSAPQRPGALRQVAGTGSSPIVAYEGTGAYFLDRLAPGVWRLELMPDALPLADPFAAASLRRVATRIDWQPQRLRLSLPNLGGSYTVRGLNAGNTFTSIATAGSVTLGPGVYLVAAPGRNTSAFTPDSQLGNIRLGEFAAPAPTPGLPVQVIHTPPSQAVAGQPLSVRATVAGALASDSLRLVVQHYYGAIATVPMRRLTPTTAAATVPSSVVYPGQLRYWIVVQRQQQATTFPGGVAGQPAQWDFAHSEHWSTLVVAPGTAVPLYQAATDQLRVETGGIQGAGWVDYVTAPSGKLALHLIQGPPAPAPPFAQPAAPVAYLRAYFGDRLAPRAAEVGNFKELVLRGRVAAGAGPVQLVLTTRDAGAYVAEVAFGTETQDLRVPLSAFRPGPQLLLPRPYPSFLPLRYEAPTTLPIPVAQLEVLQVTLGAGPASTARPYFELESVSLR